MYKIAAASLTALLIAGCQMQPGSSDWSEGDGCEKYFSETPRDLAACKAYVKAKQEKQQFAGDSSSAVTQSAVGARVSADKDIKDNETSEDNNSSGFSTTR